MRRALTAFLLLCMASAACAEDLLAGIQKQLTDAPVVRGEFSQTRELVGVKRPLKADGRFVVDKSRGVVWKTEKPFRNSLRVNRQEIVQKDGNQVLMRMTADKEPAVRTIGSVLFSLFSGDLVALARHFVYTGKQSGRLWTLDLTPKDAALGKVIRNLQLEGSTTVEHIVLTAGSGDISRIAFRNVTTANNLAGNEVADFE